MGGGLEVQFDSPKYSSRSGVQISTDLRCSRHVLGGQQFQRSSCAGGIAEMVRTDANTEPGAPLDQSFYCCGTLTWPVYIKA